MAKIIYGECTQNAHMYHGDRPPDTQQDPLAEKYYGISPYGIWDNQGFCDHFLSIYFVV